MYVCKAGHLPIRKARQDEKNARKINRIPIILRLKSVKFAHSESDAIKKERKARPIQ
jgi:hypothetical protein